MAQLVGDAQRQGLDVAGEDGLLAQLTKLVLEAALKGELNPGFRSWWADESPEFRLITIEGVAVA